eukprot:364028-Chlamydomonas_euryale.AAC.2
MHANWLASVRARPSPRRTRRAAQQRSSAAAASPWRLILYSVPYSASKAADGSIFRSQSKPFRAPLGLHASARHPPPRRAWDAAGAALRRFGEPRGRTDAYSGLTYGAHFPPRRQAAHPSHRPQQVLSCGVTQHVVVGRCQDHTWQIWNNPRGLGCRRHALRARGCRACAATTAAIGA